MDTHMCLCGKTIVGDCEIYKKERDVFVRGTRKLDGCEMEEFGRLESSEKTIAILGDRWWSKKAKQERDRISKQFICNTWKKRNEHPNVVGVSIRGGNGAPPRKGCVVNGKMTKASSKRVCLLPPPPQNQRFYSTNVSLLLDTRKDAKKNTY